MDFLTLFANKKGTPERPSVVAGLKYLAGFLAFAQTAGRLGHFLDLHDLAPLHGD
jgi:hypothetical protein